MSGSSGGVAQSSAHTRMRQVTLSPTPAPYPSVLKTSGQNIVDSNGYIMPLFRGFDIQVSTHNQQHFYDMAAKGATMLRSFVFWDQLEPTQGNISASYVSEIDNHVQRLQVAGLYTTINLYFGPQGLHMPTWAETVFAGSQMSNYIANGQNSTQYLANRYGNPTSLQYTPAVIAFGVNEPTPDDDTINDWVVTLFSQQNTMVGWFRAFAPNWIAILSSGFGASEIIPNASGSGHTDQTFTAAPASPVTGGNFIIDLHDEFMGLTTGAVGKNGRTALGITNNSITIKIGDATYNSYPPVVSGTPLPRSTCQSEHAAWIASYIAYCAPSYANCPLMIGECGWTPSIDTSGYDLSLADRRADWKASNAIITLEYEFSVNDQSSDPWSARPGGVSPVGVDLNGWQLWTDLFMGGLP